MRILLALSFALCYLFLTSEIDAQWILGPVDTLTSNEVMDQNGPEALAMDSSGTLHLVWRQEVTDSSWRILYMSKESEGDWSSPVEIPSVFANNGIPAMEVGYSTGIGHVVWHGLDTLDDDREIFYATNESGSWETLALTFDTTDDYDPTIVVDGSGYVHMAWIGSDTFSSQLKVIYATNLSGELTVQILEESEPIEAVSYNHRPGPPSIAVSLNGVIHISYGGTPFPSPPKSYSIHHIRNYSLGETDWADEAMETESFTWDEYSSLAVGEEGDVHLAVCGPLGGEPLTDYKIWHFYRPTGSMEWDPPQVAKQFGKLEQVVLTFDISEGVHLANATGWDDDGAWHIMYSTNVYPDGWHTCYALNGYPVTCYHRPSLLIDRDHYGHLIFHTSNPGSVEHYPLEILYTKSAEPLIPTPFVRGDANEDTHWSMQDALLTLKYLYVPGSPKPSCLDAADTDDSGTIEMFDAIYTLRYLYVPGSPQPPPPFPDCGIDPTWDGLGCASYSLCE